MSTCRFLVNNFYSYCLTLSRIHLKLSVWNQGRILEIQFLPTTVNSCVVTAGLELFPFEC